MKAPKQSEQSEEEVNLDNLFQLPYEVDVYEYKEFKQQIMCSKAAQTDHDLTGQVIWQAAKLLTEFILDNRQEFKGQNVIELGAGAGLAGIVCSQMAKNTWLTDGKKLIVELLEQNVEFCQCKNTKVERLQWGFNYIQKFIDEKLNGNKIDVVIGADIMFWPDCILPLVESLECFYQQNNDIKIILSGCKRVQIYEQQFDEALEKFGFKKQEILNRENILLFKLIKK